MSPITVLCIQLLIPLLTGPILAAYLKSAMHRLLVELCGNSQRADFWWRISSVLLIGLPLILVLSLGDNISMGQMNGLVDVSKIVRQTSALTLFGILIAVAYLALQMRKFMPQPGRAGERSCAS
ncbi:MAG: hypothetical protein LWW81_03860 [Rhodocyclales bacterium]|nr:hypothetical protein [Rhodocyclales bacterium]